MLKYIGLINDSERMICDYNIQKECTIYILSLQETSSQDIPNLGEVQKKEIKSKKLLIKTLTGNTFEMDFDPSSSVGQLKANIQEK